MIRTVTLPLGSRFYAYVYADDALLIAGPTRDTPAEAVSEALRYYRERAHLPRPLPPVHADVYHAGERPVRTVSSDVNGKRAKVYWGGG